jgi:HAD superfamily hydrolase (TIGR01549 family)
MSVSDYPAARARPAPQPLSQSVRRVSTRPDAITLDLDDTLWPMLPVLRGAEKALSDWLDVHAPATASSLDGHTRASLRQSVIDDHPKRAHDVGFIRLELIRRALTAAGDPPELAQSAFHAFMEARQRVELYEDVRPILEAWSTRLPLVAVTNGNADLRQIGLAHYFVGVVSAHELGCAKPDARVFHAACDLAGVTPASCLHIGDDPRLDVEGALAAGLQAVWLLRPDLADRHVIDSAKPPPVQSLHEIDAELRLVGL